MRRSGAVVLLLFVMMAVACGGSQGDQSGSAVQGDTAPGFTLPSASGGRVALSDFVRKPVLLYFSMGPG